MDDAEIDELRALQGRRRTIVTRWWEGALSPEIATELGVSKGTITGEIFALRREGIELPARRRGYTRARRRGQLPLTGSGGGS